MGTNAFSASASRRSSSSNSSTVAREASDQELDFLRQEIDFIPNSAFRTLDEQADDVVEEVLASQNAPDAPTDLPAHLQRICNVDLLTPTQEAALFREMNYLKFRASGIRERLDLSKPDPAAVEQIQALLARSASIRDHLIKANTRLVISVVKQFVTPQQSFDDLLSEGIFTLMQAVEKFDFDRGFRFSTYAYRSIARNAYRVVTTASKEESRLTRDAEEWAFGEGDASAAARRERELSDLSELTGQMVRKLDRREQFIIRSRYALGAHRKKRTLQYLADKLGISKERARQLEKRALEKLQDMAAEVDLDDLSSSPVAIY